MTLRLPMRRGPMRRGGQVFTGYGVRAGLASQRRTFMIARSQARLGAALEPGVLSRLADDTSGATAIVAALVSTVLIGFFGLGTETGLWYYKHRSMQAAADSGAVGAAVSLQAGN